MTTKVKGILQSFALNSQIVRNTGIVIRYIEQKEIETDKMDMYGQMNYGNPSMSQQAYTNTIRDNTPKNNFPKMNQENSSMPQQMFTNTMRDDMPNNNPPKSRVRCEDCDLEFTSQVVLEAHLQGSRHAKQIRAKSILESLQKSNVSYSKDEETNGLKCSACNVYLNSIQQLQTHLNGTRHKKKVSQGDWAQQGIVPQNNTMQQNFGQQNMGRNGPGVQMAANYIPQPTTKSNILTCQPCNKFFNSESQLNAHLASQKHIAKVDNKAAAKKRFVPYNRGRRGGINKANSGRKFFGKNASDTRPNPYHKPFVPGGFQMNS